MSQNTAWMAATAPRACTTCKKRKRACDKQIPMCSSCKWLQTNCQYEFPLVQALPIESATAVRDMLPWMRAEKNSIATSIQDYATTLFRSSQHLQDTIQSYFLRLHPWLPFISRPRFDGRLSALPHSSDHSLVLLTCVMYLVIAIPAEAEVGSQRSALYKDTKRLLALAECEGPVGLDLIQCRVLVALYEINHGATDEAYISLSMCARAGVVHGMNQSMKNRNREFGEYTWVRSEEGRRTWWAILILDRFLRQQRPHWPAAVSDPSSSDLLPMDDAQWDQIVCNASIIDLDPVPLLVSTASHIRVGYFARLAQVSHLLGLVLNAIYNPTADASFNEQEILQLKRTLAVYVELLPKEATAADCSHYCGPILICMSAQLNLEQSDANALNNQTEELTATAIQMGRELNAELAEVGAELLRPLALFAIYQVAKIYVQRRANDGCGKYEDGIRVLLQSLSYFEQRWRIASIYKSDIISELERISVRV